MLHPDISFHYSNVHKNVLEIQGQGLFSQLTASSPAVMLVFVCSAILFNNSSGVPSIAPVITERHDDYNQDSTKVSTMDKNC